MVTNKLNTAKRLLLLAPLSGVLMLLSACASYQVVPRHLEDRIRNDLSWEQVVNKPNTYNGMIVLWGGKVIDVKQVSGQTRVEIQHLPLDEFSHPVMTSPTGLYSAIDSLREMKDPAALQKGTLVTLIGEIRGSSGPEDDGRSPSPILVIRDMAAWQREAGTKQLLAISPLKGFRPFVFWESHRVTGYE